MTKKLFIVVLLLATVLAGGGIAQAQDDGRIVGRVTRPDGTALPGVAVRAGDQEALTNEAGSYSLEVPAGTHEVTFSLGGQSVSESGVEVAAGGVRTLDKSVDWDVSFADAITVTSVSRRAERITEAPASVTVVTAEEIEREAASGQVPKVLEFTPGVDFTQSGLYDFNFTTRGFNSSLNRRVLTLIDGRDPAVPFLGSQEWAAVSFPLDELASVELVRGPGSALYGANAFNGVLNMTTKQPRFAQGGRLSLTGGELSTKRVDLRWAGAMGESWYYKVTGGYQDSDDFARSRNQTVEYATPCAAAGQTNCLPREAVPLAVDGAEIGFGGLRFDHYFAGGNVLTLEGGYASIEGPVFQTGIGRVQVTDVARPWARLNFNTEHWNFLSYYDARDADEQVALSSGALLFEDSYNAHAELQGYTDFAGGRGRVVGGVSVHQQDVDTSNPAGVHTLMAEAKSEDQQAVFGQFEYDFTTRLKGVAAARWDDSSLHDDRFSPKGSLVWGITPNQTLRLTYNEAFQVPNYSEFFLRAPAAAPVNLTALQAAACTPFGVDCGFGTPVPVLALGNPTLEVEEITAYEIGYSGIIGGRLYLTLDYYQNEVEDFVTDLLPGVNRNLPAYAPPAALPPPVQALILQQLANPLLARIRPGLTFVGGRPAFVLSYANAGKVDTEGLEAAFNFYITDAWVLDFNYSWFDFEVKEQQLGDRLLPNAPENKFNVGLSYRHPRWDVSVKYRWVEDFDWAAGVFVGPIPEYDVVNLNANVHLTDAISLGLAVSNVTDDEHYEAFGGDLLERRALGSVTFSW